MFFGYFIFSVKHALKISKISRLFLVDKLHVNCYKSDFLINK